MALQLLFNGLSGQFDYIDVSSSNTYFLAPVADFASLPAGDPDGATRAVLDEHALYTYSTGSGTWLYSGAIRIAAVGSSPNNDGYSVSSDNTLTLQPADATHPGVLTASTQIIGGSKSFAAQINADNGVGLSSAGTLALGTDSNSGTINIGHTGATVNITGDTIYENVTTLNVSNPLINLNVGGPAGSGSSSGFTIEENSIITGYVETSGDRNSFLLKAPNTAGIATITPGSSGITLDQSSHDPLTLAAVGSSPSANGASLSSQVLTLQPADGTHPGLLSSGTQVIGGVKTFTSAPNLNSLTASQALVLDASKNVTSLGYDTANTASTLVERDGSGNFAAGTITANITGNISGSAASFTGSLVGDVTGTQGATVVALVGTSTAANVHSAELLANASTASNTNSTIVKRDGSGNFAAGVITASLTGNVTGNVSGSSGSFTGSLVGDVTGTQGATVVSFVGTSSASNVHSAELLANAATNTNTVSTIIKRDGSGNFSAGTITASLTGTASGNIVGATGDIAQTTFSLGNNQPSPIDITGLVFANASVRHAKVIYSIFIDATTPLYEGGDLNLIQKSSSWELSQAHAGDDSLITFSITSAGQVQYTSANYTGFVSGKISFRAFVTNV